MQKNERKLENVRFGNRTEKNSLDKIVVKGK